MIQPPFDVAARPARRRAFDDRRGHRRLLRVAAWLAVMVAALSHVPASAQTLAAETIAAVRQRASPTPSPAPVRIRATVTLADYARRMVFVQDATGGIFVVPAATANAAAVVAGQVVDVIGTAAVTDRGATLTNAALMPVGRAPLPSALPFESVASRLTEADGRLVSARGVVRRVHVSTGNVEVTISTVAGRFTLMQPDGAQPDLTPVDAVVSVHGVLSHLLTADRATDRVEMLAAAGAVRIEVQPVGDPFAAPLIDHAGLQEITPIGALRHRVRIAGIVTRQRPGRSLYIRAAGKPVFVETESTQPAAPGDRGEVVGFPDLDDYAPFLAEAVFRRTRVEPPPQPVVATVSQLLTGQYDAELVRVDATVDILVTDVVMPRMNGADLAKEVEKIRPGLKVLFISGHPERAGSGVDPTGATNLLMKPFTADTLAARIKEMITGKKESDGWTV